MIWRRAIRSAGPAVPQHLTVLEKAGLVARGRRAQWNDCSLATASLDEAAAWIQRFDLLDEHLTREKENSDNRRVQGFHALPHL